MIYTKETAAETARMLLQIKAIKLNPANPFTWASGWKSPIYCDNRKILSFPDTRGKILEFFVDVVKAKYANAEVIAGVATAGIPMGILIAHQLGLPFIYVRSSAKDHGLQNQIEGVLNAGQKVVVVEDLISTGGSSLRAVEAIRAAEGQVLGMAAIFSYAFPHAENNFAEVGCDLCTLSDYPHLIETALEQGVIGSEQIDLLNQWREQPDTWGK
ncbi:MAG: orotate phosphoribosyltransferase [Bacteroidetes bacterium HGW-Bacteroidetes-6]|jgi:orotate phosphoribosyltransferase|nr:MAG: orotate phosphoribosyltransferase [Bacteroidetes bacterium HGW-Bacteroidetes-6]